MIPSHRNHIDFTNTRVILKKILSEKRSRVKDFLRREPHQSIEEEKKESYSPI